MYISEFLCSKEKSEKKMNEKKSISAHACVCMYDCLY